MRLTLRNLALGASLALLLAGGAVAGLAVGRDNAQAATKDVTAQSGPNSFSPKEVTIAAGDTLTFKWVSGTHGVGAQAGFTFTTFDLKSSAPLTVTAPFATPGVVFLYCTIHADPSNANQAGLDSGAMVVKVTVAAAVVAASPSAAPSPSASASASPSAAASPSATASASASATASASASASATAPRTATATTTTTTAPPPPPPAAAAPTGGVCLLVVADQPSPSGKTLVVPVARQPKPGYVAIHENTATGGPGPVIGFTNYLIGNSQHNLLTIPMDRTLRAGETVWAMLHTEDSGNTVYDGAAIDKPTVDSGCGNPATGNIVTFPFKITAVGAPGAPNTGSVAGDEPSLLAFMALLGAAVVLLGAGGATFAIRSRR
jgi:plastocyanin